MTKKEFLGMITELAQLNHENQIHQTLQVAALSITTNPYQGLKCDIITLERCALLSITTNPYQGLKYIYLTVKCFIDGFQLPLIPIRD